MLASVFYGWSAMFTVSRLVWVEATAVFACWGMVREGAGHTAHGLNVIPRERQEEALRMLVADVRLEQSVKTRLVFGTSHYKCCSTCLTLIKT